MALTTVNITGTFNFPDATWAQYTTAEFMISGYDTDAQVVVPGTISSTLGAGGSLSVNLWANDSGLRGTVYRVNIVVYDSSNYTKEVMRRDLGKIQIQASGPFDISSLLDLPATVPGFWHSTITQAEYDAAIAAASAAAASEAAAAVSAASAAASATVIPINSQVSNYTLILSDAGKQIEMDSATDVTLTVPANSAVAFGIGVGILVTQAGDGAVTIAGASGVTINSVGGYTTMKSQWSSVIIIKRATDEWVMIGDLI